MESIHGVVTDALDYDIVVCEFELPSRYRVHFWIRKVWTLLF